jgi:hypothetical protein
MLSSRIANLKNGGPKGPPFFRMERWLQPAWLMKMLAD